MSLLPTHSSAKASTPLPPTCGFFPPSQLSTELPGTYFLQIIVYAFHHSALHFRAGLVVQSARDDEDITFFQLKSPGASNSIRRDPKPCRMSKYKLIPIPVSICETQLSGLHHLLKTTIVPCYESGPDWVRLALIWLEALDYLPKGVGFLCWLRMCSAVDDYASRRDGAPWDVLKGQVNVDVLDGPTQVVVMKRPLATGLDYDGRSVCILSGKG